MKKNSDSREKYVSLKLLLEESRVGIAKFLTLLEGQGTTEGLFYMPSIPEIPQSLVQVENKVSGILEAVRLVADNELKTSQSRHPHRSTPKQQRRSVAGANASDASDQDVSLFSVVHDVASAGPTAAQSSAKAKSTLEPASRL